MGNEVCWRECNKRGGKCSFCGDGYCCNGKKGTYPGWNGNCPEGAIAVAPLNGHRCIHRTEITMPIITMPITTTITTPTTTKTTKTSTTSNCKLLFVENSVFLLLHLKPVKHLQVKYVNKNK